MRSLGVLSAFAVVGCVQSVSAADLGGVKPEPCGYILPVGIQCKAPPALLRSNRDVWRPIAFGAVSTVATGLVLQEWLRGGAVSSSASRTPNAGLTLSVSSGFSAVERRSTVSRNFTGAVVPGLGTAFLVGAPQSALSSGTALSSLEGISAVYTRPFGTFSLGLALEWLHLGAGIDRILPVQDGSLGLRSAIRADWAASAAVRAGFDLSDRLALWVQAGPAVGRVRVGSGLELVSGLWSERASEKLGWTAGVGTDLRLSDGWLISLGYSYVDLGSRRTAAQADNGRFELTSKSKVSAHVVRLSVGYRW